MKTGFHFKLGVGIILVFGVLLAGYAVHEPLQFKYYESLLYSGRRTDIAGATAFFFRHGEEGLKVLEKYCQRKTDKSFGKQVKGLCMRISTAAPVVDEIKEPSWNSGLICVEIMNVSDNSISFLTWTNSISDFIEPVSSYNIKIYGIIKKMDEYNPILLRGWPVKVLLKPTGKYGESSTNIDDNLQIRGTGLYSIQAVFNGFPGVRAFINDKKGNKARRYVDKPDWCECLTSNRITFIIRPGRNSGN